MDSLWVQMAALISTNPFMLKAGVPVPPHPLFGTRMADDLRPEEGRVRHVKTAKGDKYIFGVKKGK